MKIVHGPQGIRRAGEILLENPEKLFRLDARVNQKGIEGGQVRSSMTIRGRWALPGHSTAKIEKLQTKKHGSLRLASAGPILYILPLFPSFLSEFFNIP